MPLGWRILATEAGRGGAAPYAFAAAVAVAMDAVKAVLVAAPVTRAVAVSAL